MSTFQEIFQAYGADYTATMERFMGNETMYLKLLDMLFQDDNLKKLEQAVTEKDYTTAFEAAHTLKGVAGNMGLTPLYEAVCAIVEPLRAREQRDDYLALYQVIEQAFVQADELRRQLKQGER